MQFPAMVDKLIGMQRLGAGEGGGGVKGDVSTANGCVHVQLSVVRNHRMTP